MDFDLVWSNQLSELAGIFSSFYILYATYDCPVILLTGFFIYRLFIN